MKKQKIPTVFNNILKEINSTQVVIMAGGLGKRMGLNIPKALIKIHKKHYSTTVSNSTRTAASTT